MSLTSSFWLDNISRFTTHGLTIHGGVLWHKLMLTFTPVHELDGVIFVFDVRNKQVLLI